LMPAVEALAAEYQARLKVVKVNASIRPNWRLSGENKVLGLPAYLFFSGGQEIKRLSGDGVTRASLAEAIEEIVNDI
jgi:thioredoxin 1